MPAEIDIDQIESEAYARVCEIKRARGRSLLILGHHYQRRRIIEVSDHVGDSYALAAKAAASNEAEHIVFCGVRFMAESAAVLSAPHQTVHHPNAEAGCPMADMASLDDVEIAYELAAKHASGAVVPLAYMNSSADVKAFCGRNGGLVCTSSNAPAAMKWAYRRGRVVLFLPDEHLAANSSDALGIPAESRTIFDPREPEGGEQFRVGPETQIVMWKGHCHVHTLFKPEHVHAARRADPNAIVVVHPECTSGVVALADVSGSTARIVEITAQAPDGATIIVGTEINLVERLAIEHAGKKRILPLVRSFCPNMYKINLRNLGETLSQLASGRFGVNVPAATVSGARIALQRMLEVA